MNFRMKGNIKERVYEYLKLGGVTFVEITGAFGKGEYAYCVDEHIVCGWNLTEEVADAIKELYDEKKILFYPTNMMTYVIDGAALRLPIAKTARHYKRDHWFPVVIWRTEMAKEILCDEHRKLYASDGYDI